MAGNERFAAGKITSFAADLEILKQKTVSKQEPLAAVLSRANSRVPVEIIFDESIGQIFVSRVAGNIVTPEIMASLEYGVAVLGVKAILVLGHSNCGAISAAVAGKEVPGQISVLYQHPDARDSRCSRRCGRCGEGECRFSDQAAGGELNRDCEGGEGEGGEGCRWSL